MPKTTSFVLTLLSMSHLSIIKILETMSNDSKLNIAKIMWSHNVHHHSLCEHLWPFNIPIVIGPTLTLFTDVPDFSLCRTTTDSYAEHCCHVKNNVSRARC